MTTDDAVRLRLMREHKKPEGITLPWCTGPQCSTCLALRIIDAAEERAEAAEKRVAELQALVDAATMYRFGDIVAGESADRTKWQVYAYGQNWVIDAASRDEALARALAEKEKGT